MLTSFYIGLGGMNAYSRGLGVISNNVANLNTSGFKASHPKFVDVVHGPAGGSAFRTQGLGAGGVRQTEARLDVTQGELRASANDLDLGVDGAGYLVLLDGGERLYTRTGAFTVDKDGFVVLGGSPRRLAVLNAAGRPEAVNVDARRVDPPVATTTVKLADNLSSTANDAAVADIAVYDATGQKRVWQARFTPVGAASPGEWTVRVVDDQNRDVGSAAIKFVVGTIDPASKTFTVIDTTTPAQPLTVTFDLSQVTSFSSGTTSTIRAASTDGSPVGALSTVTVDENGEIKLTYTNTRTASLGAIALADIRAPDALETQGAGLFIARGNQPPPVVSSRSAIAGKVRGKALEASNVNLSQEFGDLILVQRGFQASSQIVSVTNEMLQQLFGIRGNG